MLNIVLILQGFCMFIANKAISEYRFIKIKSFIGNKILLPYFIVEMV